MSLRVIFCLPPEKIVLRRALLPNRSRYALPDHAFRANELTLDVKAFACCKTAQANNNN